MSIVYGHLKLAHTINSVQDFVGLVNALNKFSWSDALPDAKWTYDENSGIVQFESKLIEDPTGLPKIFIAEIKDPNFGEVIQKYAQDMTTNDYENLIQIEGDHADLKQFAYAIKPFLNRGFIKVTCEASDKKGLSYTEQVTVYYDGTGVASWIINRPNGDLVTESESF